MFAGNRLRPVTAHLARRHAASLSQPSHPSNDRADGNRELFEPPDCRTARQSRPQQSLACEDPQSKACPSTLASTPASTVYQKRRDLGIPNRFSSLHPAFSERRLINVTTRQPSTTSTVKFSELLTDPMVWKVGTGLFGASRSIWKARHKPSTPFLSTKPFVDHCGAAPEPQRSAWVARNVGFHACVGHITADGLTWF